MYNNPLNPYGPGGPTMPPRQPLPHQRVIAWYHAKRARKPVVTGCLTAFAALVVLLLCGTISGIANGGLQSLTREATPTPVVQKTPIHATPTRTPAPKPTAAPAHTATPVPTATPQPTAAPVPTATPTPVPIVCAGGTQIEGACYNYDLAGGSLVYSPPASFCAYFACVSTFWTSTNGYVVKCGDGKHSHSGGVAGACSRNGGVVAAIYQH
jgi:hypothetical protein